MLHRSHTLYVDSDITHMIHFQVMLIYYLAYEIKLVKSQLYIYIFFVSNTFTIHIVYNKT